MTNKVILTNMNYNENIESSVRYAKKQTRPSLTVPDQSLTIEEILKRFVVGESLPIGKNVYHDGEDPDFNDYDPTLDPNFDLADATQIKMQIAERKEALRIRTEEARQRSEVERQPSEGRSKEASSSDLNFEKVANKKNVKDQKKNVEKDPDAGE